MRWRYKAENLPIRGVGAFAPTQSLNPSASSYGLVHVAGAPGSLAVAVEPPSALPVVSVNPKTAPSNCAPNVIFPSVYVASVANMGPQVPIRPANVMPAPATDFVRVARTDLRPPPRLGGRRVIPWPRAFQRWGSVTGTPAS